MREEQQPQTALRTRIVRIAWTGWIAVQLALALIPSARSAPPESPAGKRDSTTREAAPAASAQDGDALHKDTKSKSVGEAPRAKSSRKEYIDRLFSLGSQKEVDALLASFPDVSAVTDVRVEHVRVPVVPDEFLRRLGLRGKNVETLEIGFFGADHEKITPAISDQGMEYISRLQNLRRLWMACRCSAKGLAHLTKLPELKTLGLDHLTLSSREVFEVVARMPKIQTLGLRYCDFSHPIDAATHKAIASLNGRLECLTFGEWGETKIHRSMFPAIAEIKSLTWLELGEFTATYDDLKPIRANLRNLRHIGPNTEATEGIRTVKEPTRKK